MMSGYFSPINFTSLALLTQKNLLSGTNTRKKKDDNNFPSNTVFIGGRKKSGCSYRIMDLMTNSILIL